jgi:hypothetical protein
MAIEYASWPVPAQQHPPRRAPLDGGIPVLTEINAGRPAKRRDHALKFLRLVTEFVFGGTRCREGGRRSSARGVTDKTPSAIARLVFG